MKAIKDQVRTLLGPSLAVSDTELNRAYRRFLRYNGPGCHPYYSACKIADFLTINDRVQPSPPKHLECNPPKVLSGA
jgi:hypothetical protein